MNSYAYRLGALGASALMILAAVACTASSDTADGGTAGAAGKAGAAGAGGAGGGGGTSEAGGSGGGTDGGFVCDYDGGTSDAGDTACDKCVAAKCDAEIKKCVAEEKCLKAECDLEKCAGAAKTPTDEGKCWVNFSSTGGTATDLGACVDKNCKTDCGL